MCNKFQSKPNIADKVNTWLARTYFEGAPRLASKADMDGKREYPIILDDLSDLAPLGYHTSPIIITEDSDTDPSEASPRRLTLPRNASIRFLRSMRKPSNPATQFLKFKELPRNIQTMIWNEAIASLPKVGRPRFKLTLSVRDAETAHNLNSTKFDATDPGITACFNARPELIDGTKDVRALLRACSDSREATKAAPGGQLLWMWYKNRAGDARRAWVPFDHATGAMSLEIEPFVMSADEHDAAVEIIRPYAESYDSVDMVLNMAGLEFAHSIRSLHILLPWSQTSKLLGRDLQRDRMSEECLALVKRFQLLEELKLRASGVGQV